MTRYLTAVENGERVGLISFTNAAVDEARRRAGRHRVALHPPHFVGTIDTFLHQFFVTPEIVRKRGRRPTYLPSWDDLPDSHPRRTMRLRNVPGVGVRLSCFRPADGKTTLIDARLDRNERFYVAEVDEQASRAELVALAHESITKNLRGALLDSELARAVAYALVRPPESRLIERICTRFTLLLVDEAQDCDAAEFAVLRRVAERIPVVFVADPDQAIFEFRGGTPSLFSDIRDEQPAAARMAMSTNYRSTPAICAVTTGLRCVGDAEIIAADATDQRPVLVIEGTPAQQGRRFLEALAGRGLEPDDAIVLAHGWALATSVAGRSRPPKGTACGDRLAYLCGVLDATPSSPEDRIDALRECERILLHLVDWKKPERRRVNRTDQLLLLDRSDAWLRSSAGLLMAQLRAAPDRDTFGRVARDTIATILSDLPRPHVKLASNVKRPTAAMWTKRAKPMTDTLRFSTIHSAKGREFPAVLLAISSGGDGDPLADWAADHNTEPRRVLYVGASRAQQLLAFGCKPQDGPRLLRLLETHNVAALQL